MRAGGICRRIARNPFRLWQPLPPRLPAPTAPREAPPMPASANVLSQKLRHGGVARSPLADTELLGETFARGVEDRMRLLVKTLIGTTVGAARVAKLADATADDHRAGDARPRRRRGRRHARADRARVRPRLPPDRPDPRRRRRRRRRTRWRGPSPPSTWRSAGCTSTPSSPPSAMRSAPTSAGR